MSAIPQAVADGWVWDMNEGRYLQPITGDRVDQGSLSSSQRSQFPPQSRLLGSSPELSGPQDPQPPHPEYFTSPRSTSAVLHPPSTFTGTQGHPYLGDISPSDIWNQPWTGAAIEDKNYTHRHDISTANDHQIAAYVQAFGELPPASLFAPSAGVDSIQPLAYTSHNGQEDANSDSSMGSNHSSSVRTRPRVNHYQQNSKGKERATEDGLYDSMRELPSSDPYSTHTYWRSAPYSFNPSNQRYGNGEDSAWWEAVNGASTSTATPSPSFPIPARSAFTRTTPSDDDPASTFPEFPAHNPDDDASLALALALAEESGDLSQLDPSFLSPSREEREANDLAFALQLQLSLEGEDSDDLASQEAFARQLQDQLALDVAAAIERQEQEDRDLAEALALEFETERMNEENEAEAQRKREQEEECSVCLEDKDKDTMLLLPCRHYICITQECLHAPIEIAIKTSKPYRCCLLPIVPDLLKPHLPSNLFEPYRKVYIESRTSNPLYCANPSCSAFIEPTAIAGGVGTCASCSTRTCRHCKQVAHKGVCKEDKDGNGVKKLGKQKGWKQCPNCGEMVEKNQGCDHMTCKCSTEFCYKCGKLYSVCPGRC